MKVSGVDLRSIAEEFGTPTYVIDFERVRENYIRLNEALECPHVIAYAYKANHEPELVRMLALMGSGATVPSAYGVMLARWAGVTPDKIVLVGPSPSRYDLEEALRYGALISLESESEAKVLGKMGRARVMVRVNTGIEAGAHPSLVTGGKRSKFGLPPRRALTLLKSLSSTMEVEGIHTHIGSQILSVEPFKRAVELLTKLARDFGEVKVIDMGGGLGIPYLNEGAFPLEEYSDIVCDAANHVGATLFVESGRYIVGDAGYLLTRVNYVKEVGKEKWLLIDAGMNDLLRPALYNARHRIIAEGDGPEERYLVAGPVCESADVFGEYYLPRLKEGDLIAIGDVGAYGFSMASRYNLRPLPAVISVDKGRYRLLRERESFGRAIF